MRIVSLLPSATEIAYALGLQVVGVTFECDWPPEVRGTPVVSSSALDAAHLPLAGIDAAVASQTDGGQPLYRIDEALLAELAPDLILTQDLCRVCAVPSGDVDEALDRLGCRAEVLSLDPHSLDDVLIDIERVGDATDRRPQADLLVATLRSRIAAVEAAASLRDVTAPNRPRVAVLEWVDPPWGAGHWIPEMVERAGGDPVLGRAGRESRRFAWADLTEAEPELILVAPCGFHLAAAAEQAATVLTQPEVRALAPQVWAIDADAYVVRPGPRLVDGLEAMSWLLDQGMAGADPAGCPVVGALARVSG